MELKLSPKQLMFVEADASEVFFGGAAGGGKSFAQVADALIYAVKYSGSRQLILRRTFPELERSIIRAATELFPRQYCKYNATRHTFIIAGGSTIEFGCCEGERDVIRYQSAEYDCIRFDELTHFTSYQYLYLSSRNRGANDFPKQIKSTGNPGGIGHGWVKARFISPAPPQQRFSTNDGSRVFIAARVSDNPFLMRADPDYAERLKRLPETERRALLEGDWDIEDGQFFSEFRRGQHTVKPFKIPPDWLRYRSIDYGLDMFACLWIAISPQGHAYVYRELLEPGLIISRAAAETLLRTGDEKIEFTFAPPDLWSRQRETGATTDRLFAREGVSLTKASNNRVGGWLALKEWLAPDENGEARLRIFDTCRGLIDCIPALLHDSLNPNDCARNPHDITHAPDALRYFAVSRSAPGTTAGQGKPLPYALINDRAAGEWWEV